MVQERRATFELRAGRSHAIVRALDGALQAETPTNPGIYALALERITSHDDKRLREPGGFPIAYLGVATNLQERCITHFEGPAKASGFRITAWGLLRASGIAPGLSGDEAEAWLTAYLAEHAVLVWADCIYPRGIESFLLKHFTFPCNLQGQRGATKEFASRARHQFAAEIIQ